MSKYIPTFLLFFLCHWSFNSYGQLIVEGQNASTFDLVGKWQSLNKSNIVIEFTTSGNYIVFRDQKRLLDLVYKIDSKNAGLFEISFNLEADTTEPGKATIQIVSRNRIRLYSWKHMNVLDSADEYYRTDDLISFPKLIKKVINETK